MSARTLQRPNRVSIVVAVVLLAAVLSVILFVESNFYLSLLTQCVIFGILALSYQLVFGIAGQISLAHAIFFGIGGYTSAILTLHYDWPYIPAFLAAGIMSGLFSLVLTPLSRLREVYFGLASLAYSFILLVLISNGGKLTGGHNGLLAIPYPNLFGWEVRSKKDFFILSIIVLVLAYLFMRRLISGRIGRDFLAIKDSPLAAHSIGINAALTKTKAFILGCIWAGFAGSLMVHTFSFVSPDPFGLEQTTNVVIMVVLGGLGSLPGAIIGAFGVTLLDEALASYPFARPIIYGTIIILLMIYVPQGLMGLAKKISDRRKPKMQRSQGTSPANAATGQEANLELLKNYLKKDHVQQQGNEAMLEVKQITKKFGGITAIRDATLTVKRGEIFALIGPNGAGKTTLINMVSGLEKPTSGEVYFNGQRVDTLSLYKVARKGMARTFQTSKLFDSMTVLENVMAGMSSNIRNDVGLALLQNKQFREEEAKIREIARELIRFVNLEHLADEVCKNLSYGHRRLVEVARALASRPSMILLDEPAAGLNLAERERLKQLIVQIRDEFNITIFIVEHDLNLLTQISDHMAVLNFGVKISDGTAEHVMNDPEVIKAYLGRSKQAHA